MAPLTAVRETVDDLYRVEGKAELIGGRIFRYMPTGALPNLVAIEILFSLRTYAKSSGRGHAYSDGIGFIVSELPSGRESFSPDASYHAGSLPVNPMRFVEGAPTFAVEVRSESDLHADDEIAAKRVDYFQAGTLVVWDVDPVAKTIAVYRAATPDQPTIFRSGDIAEAEPAVPGWRVRVDDVFNFA